MENALKEKLDAFFTKYKHQLCKKGEILIRADEEPSAILYLKNGRVKEYAISHKGNEIVVGVFKPISFFPMSWAVNKTENHYYYEAIEDIDVWKAPADDVVTFVKNEPDVLLDLLKRVYHGTDGLLMRMTYLMSGNAYAKLIAEILIHMRRFGSKNQDGHMSVTVTEVDIAAYAGLTRETVSREIKKLKDKGLVSFLGKTLVVYDLEALQHEAEVNY